MVLSLSQNIIMAFIYPLSCPDLTSVREEDSVQVLVLVVRLEVVGSCRGAIKIILDSLL